MNVWNYLKLQGRVYIRDGATVDREDSSILTDNEGNGVVTFTIQAVNSAPTGVLTSTQNAQVLQTHSVFKHECRILAHLVQNTSYTCHHLLVAGSNKDK